MAQFQSRREEILNAVIKTLDTGVYILGAEVERFEDSFAKYCGSNYGVGVNSGTDALALTLRALDIGPGDEVITVALTALATIAAIVSCGATPVLVEVDPLYYTMDLVSLQSAITTKTKAIIPVHLFGQCVDMEPILKIAKTNKLYVVEDCAQSAGALYQQRKAGSIGDAGCFSFYPTKNLGAIGDGGIVVTKNEALAIRIRSLRQYGWDKNRNTIEVGFNSRLDEIQAAILNVKLKYLDEDNAKRRDNAHLYSKELEGLGLNLPAEMPETQHAFHLYVVSSHRRDELIQELNKFGVAAGIHYPLLTNLQGGYDALCKLPNSGLEKSQKLTKTFLSLPMYPELNSLEVEKVSKILVEMEAKR